MVVVTPKAGKIEHNKRMQSDAGKAGAADARRYVASIQKHSIIWTLRKADAQIINPSFSERPLGDT